MKVAACLIATLAVAGCFVPNTTPVFVPTCDQDAPKHYEAEVFDSDRVSPTMQSFETKGWMNITKRSEGMDIPVDIISGDCTVGTASEVRIDTAKYKFSREPGDLPGTLLGMFAVFVAGLMVYGATKSVSLGLAGGGLGVGVGVALGWLSSLQAIVILVISAALAVAIFRPWEVPE